VHGRLAEAARGRERLAAAVGAAGLGVFGGRGRSPAARHTGRAAERACTPRQPGRLTSCAPLLAADPRVLRLTTLSFLTRWLTTFGLQVPASCQLCRRETSSRPTQGMLKRPGSWRTSMRAGRGHGLGARGRERVCTALGAVLIGHQPRARRQEALRCDTLATRPRVRPTAKTFGGVTIRHHCEPREHAAPLTRPATEHVCKQRTRPWLQHVEAVYAREAHRQGQQLAGGRGAAAGTTQAGGAVRARAGTRGVDATDGCSAAPAAGTVVVVVLVVVVVVVAIRSSRRSGS